MSKINYLLTSLVLSLVLFSCSSENKSITPKSSDIKGELGEYYEVVNKDYLINKKENEAEIIVEIKKKSTELPYSSISAINTGQSTDYLAGLGIELFDNDNPILIREASDYFYMPSESINNLLKLKSGETAFLTWSIPTENIDKFNNFQITSSITKQNITSNEDSNSEYISEKPEQSNKNQNWDEFLNEYEEYVDEYLQLMTKAKKGDMSALEHYPSLLEKAEKMDKNLLKAQSNNELSSKQISKMMKIQTKLLNAASQQ